MKQLYLRLFAVFGSWPVRRVSTFSLIGVLLAGSVGLGCGAAGAAAEEKADATSNAGQGQQAATKPPTPFLEIYAKLRPYATSSAASKDGTLKSFWTSLSGTWASKRVTVWSEGKKDPKQFEFIYVFEKWPLPWQEALKAVGLPSEGAKANLKVRPIEKYVSDDIDEKQFKDKAYTGTISNIKGLPGGVTLKYDSGDISHFEVPQTVLKFSWKK